MSNETKNAQSAARAELALKAYTELRDMPVGWSRYLLIDFLTDLMHYCRQEDIDLLTAIETARESFRDET